MNADLVKTGRLRRSPQGQGTLYPVLQSAKSRQQKPVFRSLEGSAINGSLVTKTEHEAVAKVSERPITSIKPLDSISYAFSFPLCDLLICEFPEFVPNSEQAKASQPKSIVTRDNLLSSVKKVSRVAYYKYQKVIRRKAIPFQPSPKNPNYLLCYVEEELECGHKVTVHPGALETLTARKRNCSECSSWFGGLKLPEGKKPNKSILRSYERIKKQAGETGWWAIAVAVLFLVGFFYIAYLLRPKFVFYSAPDDTFRVISQESGSDYNFVLQQVHDGIPRVPAVYHFCASENPPRFQIGETLDQLIYEDKGDCQRLAHGIAYVIRRDQMGWPKLAANCVNLGVKQPVICVGKPQF